MLKVKIKIKKLYLTSLIRNRQHKLVRAFIVTKQYLFNRYLPALLYLPSTTPFMQASAREPLVPFLHFGMVRLGFEPMTSGSESGHFTN